ncbi:hypothetical protein PG987_007466 [Apiospora arundinis]
MPEIHYLDDSSGSSNPDGHGKSRRRTSANSSARQRIVPPARDGAKDIWILQGANEAPGVRRVGNSGPWYQFIIPLFEIPGFNRIALGVRDNATMMVIHLAIYASKTKFTIRFLPRDAGAVSNVIAWSTRKPWDDHSSRHCCGSDSNFLTHLMAKILHQSFKSKEQSVLRTITAHAFRYGFIQAAGLVSHQATRRCIISSSTCAPSLGFAAARPIACSEKCLEEFQKWPLAIRLSPLLRDPSVVDLLLTCLHSQLTAILMSPHLNAADKPTLALGSVGSEEAGRMLRTLDIFPPMVSGITLHDIVVSSPKKGKERRDVLDLLCSKFQGMIIRESSSEDVAFRLPIHGAEFKPETFLLLNTHAQRQTKFEEQLYGFGQVCGSPAFHGTPAQNVFSILCDGLKQNAQSDGYVWFAGTPFYSTYYMWRGLPHGDQLLYRSWHNSRFIDRQLLFGVEVAGATKLDSQPTDLSAQDRLMVRHLFFIPAEFQELYKVFWAGGEEWARHSIWPKMKETFLWIHYGSLIREKRK